MTERGLVSIIITTFGRPTRLDEAISSVLKQTYQNFELIVVDDNEPTSINRSVTRTLAEKYRALPNFCYCEHPKNLNGAAARNTGFQHARGEYIAFLDNDDTYARNRLKECVAGLSNPANLEYGAVYTGCAFMRGGQLYSVKASALSGNFLNQTLACNFGFYTGSNLFIRADCYRQLGGFDESFWRHQDYEFLARFFQKYEILGINKILVTKNNDNLNLPDVTAMFDIKKRFLEKFRFLLEEFPVETQNEIYSAHYYSLSEQAIRSGRFDDALYYATECRRYKPMTIAQTLRLFYFYIRAAI